MTEVASLLPSDHRLTSVRRYEAGPPEGLELVEPGETVATTKEEEWVSKKKTEVINTKQIETRVKRQVVLEDGEVVEDTGPMVTTNTTEDTETQEHHQTELRKLGDDDVDGRKALEGPPGDEPDGSKWVAVPNPDGIVREVKEKKIISREETEEVKETEDVQHFGDITDEDFLAAVKSGKKDLRDVLRTTKDGLSVVSTGPRLVHESSKSNKVIDTEDTRELSSVLPDGKIVTETQRTTEHEEIKDDELPEDAPEQDFYKESSQRYLKTRDQEDVDYLADGVKIGHEMRFRTETMEVERHGDDDDEPDFDSLSARARRRAANRQPHRYRGLENGISPLDRKDALTKKPLDFDQEEETRKVETSKWLEHHFGSESRSSNNSVIDDEEQPPKTSFFNVTIKSQPTRTETPPQKYITTINNGPRVYSPVEPERDRPQHSEYYKGISQWSERHHMSPSYQPEPVSYHQDTPIYVHEPVTYPPERPSPIDRPPRYSPPRHSPPRRSPIPDYRTSTSTSSPAYRDREPLPPPIRISPIREITPTPPQRKRVSERRHQVDDRGSRYTNSRVMNGRCSEPMAEPPPDYSPPNPVSEKRAMQKTRFAPDPPKAKSGNIIGQSIRKLVGKIRSASSERKSRQNRTKRSPSPSYQKGHVIDNNINSHHHNGMENKQPVQRYYLGEDPFGGSIYGRENKYDGVKPARSSKRKEDEHRSQSTLGRFSKSTSRLLNSSAPHERNSQTLPRHLSRHHEPPTRLEKNNKSNSTINVSIINTVSRTLGPQLGPAKPARTYKSNLSRSKSLNVHANDYRRPGMYTSNPHLNRLEENPVGLKSPGLISSLSRSQKDLHEDSVYTNRFVRNGTSENTSDNKRVFMKSLKDRAPELFKTLHEDEPDAVIYSTPVKNHHKNKYNGDIYEPPTRLREPQSILRRGSNSSTDYSETYHTTTRNDDPLRPSVTNTVKSFTKKTIPSKNGRLETIESSETKSVTKSHYRGDPSVKFYETERRYSGGSPVVIEVRNSNSNYRK